MKWVFYLAGHLLRFIVFLALFIALAPVAAAVLANVLRWLVFPIGR
jgi:hypothetical protein